MQCLPRFSRSLYKTTALFLLGFLRGIAALAIPAWLWWIRESWGMRSDQLMYSVNHEILLHVIRKDPLHPSKRVGVSIPDLCQRQRWHAPLSEVFFIGPRRSRHTVPRRQFFSCWQNGDLSLHSARGRWTSSAFRGLRLPNRRNG